MSRTVSGTATQQTWDLAEGLPLILSDGAANYVYGPGGRPLEQVTSSATLFYYQDRLGSTRAVADITGTVVATYTYDAYGRLTGSTGWVATPLGYGGQYVDAESGMVYLRARYYDPTTAQFLTRDPAVDVTLSAYGYVDGDPLNSIDPLGLWGWHYIAKFVKDHGVQIAVGAAIVGGAICLASVACGVAVVGALGPEALAGAAGLGVAGTVAALVGGAPDPAPDQVLYRIGNAPETADKLGGDAAAAVKAGFPHGVSVLSRTNSAVACPALRSAIEEFFPVEKTGKGASHYTVVLPKPVTEEVAHRFNQIFGRL